MNCIEFEKVLEQAVEERREPLPVEVDQHARDCAACRALLEGHRRLATAISAWCGTVPDVDLVDATLSQLECDEATTSPAGASPLPRRRRLLSPLTAGSVAAIALALVAGWYGTRPSLQPVSVVTGHSATEVEPEPRVERPILVAEAESVATGTLAAPLSAFRLGDFESVGRVVPDEELAELREGFAPLGTSVGKALAFFREALPTPLIPST